MANTSFTIISTAQGSDDKIQNTLTDINPAATNSQINAFVQALNGLSDNTYVGTTRVDKTNCDTEEGPGKQYRNLQITGAEQGATATISANTEENGTVNPAIFFYSNNTATAITSTVIEPRANSTVIQRTFTVPSSAGTIFSGVRANDDFYADFVSATVE